MVKKSLAISVQKILTLPNFNALFKVLKVRNKEKKLMIINATSNKVRNPILSPSFSAE